MGAPLIAYRPNAVGVLFDILPADLADIMRAAAGGFEIDDADARQGLSHRRFVLPGP